MWSWFWFAVLMLLLGGGLMALGTFYGMFMTLMIMSDEEEEVDDWGTRYRP